MKKDEFLEQLREFLKTKFQMVLATSDKHPWIATVYFSYDDDLNFYFLSYPGTIHCQQIAKNPKVAIAIADSPQAPTGKKIGLQIYGVAKQVSGKSKVTHAINLWRKSLGVKRKNYSYEGMMKKMIKGRMYQITPKKIRFFNEEIWKEGTEPVVEL